MLLRPAPWLVQAIRQQDTVKQTGDRVVMLRVWVVFHVPSAGDVREQGNIMLNLAVSITNDADRLHFCVDFAILAFVPDFTEPVPVPGRSRHMSGVKLASGAPDLSRRGVCPNTSSRV